MIFFEIKCKLQSNLDINVVFKNNSLWVIVSIDINSISIESNRIKL